MNLELYLFGGLLFSFLVTVCATYMLCKFALKFGLVDEPDFRKVHVKPIPRIGGLAIFAGFVAGHTYFAIGSHYFPEYGFVMGGEAQHLIIGTILIALTGLADDIHGISFRQKLSVQCLAAVYMILAGFRLPINLPFLPEPLQAFPELLSITLTFVWIVGVINALNLLDGLDGLAGGTAFVSLISITCCLLILGADFSADVTIAMLAAILGFMVFNYNPASIFMGDTGSLLLGFFLASISLTTTSESSSFFILFVPIFCVGLPVFDTLLAIIRRKLSGRPIFYPDKDHIHHRIARIWGLSHKMTAITLWGFAAVFGGLAMLISTGVLLLQLLALVLAIAFVAIVLIKLEFINKEVIIRKLETRSRTRRTKFRTFVAR